MKYLLIILALTLTACNKESKESKAEMLKRILKDHSATPEAIEEPPKENKIQKLMDKALAVTLLDKFMTKGKYTREFINFKLSLHNKTTKRILGVKGTLIIKDIFDDTIARITLSLDEELEANSKNVVVRTLKFNKYIDRIVKLKNIKPDKIKYEWVGEAYLFTDGSSIKKEL